MRLFAQAGDVAIFAVAESTEDIGIGAGGEATGTAIDHGEVANSLMEASPADKTISFGVDIRFDGNGWSADAGGIEEYVTIENECIAWGLTEFLFGDVHFTGEESVTGAIDDIADSDSIMPVLSWFAGHAGGAAGDNDSGPVSTVDEVGGESKRSRG